MWWSYEDAQEKKDQVQREIEKRTRRGEVFEPLAVTAGKKKLCTTFWGQAWCRHLETYQVYEARLPRGRTYLRQGQVYNLTIQPGSVSAIVTGAALYETRIQIKPLGAEHWQRIVTKGAGEVTSMLDLLAGRLGQGLIQQLCDPAEGLFPQVDEIRFNCSCVDDADLCKHAAAVLYGVGVLLDAKPELLFSLRGVDHAALLAGASQTAAADMAPASGELEGADLSALFGIDLTPHAEEPRG